MTEVREMSNNETAWDKETIREQLMEGRSMASVAREYGVSTSAVQHLMARYIYQCNKLEARLKNVEKLRQDLTRLELLTKEQQRVARRAASAKRHLYALLELLDRYPALDILELPMRIENCFRQRGEHEGLVTLGTLVRSTPRDLTRENGYYNIAAVGVKYLENHLRDLGLGFWGEAIKIINAEEKE
jgi:predicted DNA-binding protein YlxM (UPF0122 family)